MIGQRHIGIVKKEEVIERASDRAQEYVIIKNMVKDLRECKECEHILGRVSSDAIKRLMAVLPYPILRIEGFRVVIII